MKNHIKITHYQSLNDKLEFSRPAITIASKLTLSDNGLNILEFAFAICGKKDQFSKKKGANLAIERLNSGNHKFYHCINLPQHTCDVKSFTLQQLIANFIDLMDPPHCKEIFHYGHS